MQLYSRSKILVVTNGREDPKKIRAMFPDNGAGKEIMLARSHRGALEMARTVHPQLCILSDHMVLLHGHYFPDVLNEACPGIDIFIAEDQDLAAEADAASSSRS